MDRPEPRAAGRFWGVRPPLCPPQACGQLPPGFLALILGPTMGLVAGRGNRGSVLIFFGMNKIITACERERHLPLWIFLLSPLFPTCLYCHNFPTSFPGIYYSLWRNSRSKTRGNTCQSCLAHFAPDACFRPPSAALSAQVFTAPLLPVTRPCLEGHRSQRCRPLFLK